MKLLVLSLAILAVVLAPSCFNQVAALGVPANWLSNQTDSCDVIAWSTGGPGGEGLRLDYGCIGYALQKRRRGR